MLLINNENMFQISLMLFLFSIRTSFQFLSSQLLNILCLLCSQNLPNLCAYTSSSKSIVGYFVDFEQIFANSEIFSWYNMFKVNPKKIWLGKTHQNIQAIVIRQLWFPICVNMKLKILHFDKNWILPIFSPVFLFIIFWWKTWGNFWWIFSVYS